MNDMHGIRPSGYTVKITVWGSMDELPEDAIKDAEEAARFTLVEEIARRGDLLRVDMDSLRTDSVAAQDFDDEGNLRDVVHVRAQVRLV